MIDDQSLMEKRQDGRVSKICMRYKCHQPIWVRDYVKYSNEKPLFCTECWMQLYMERDMLVTIDKYKEMNRFELEKKIIESLLAKKD